MAGIFLSYSRADRSVAQQIAEALEAEGFTVWWDKILRAGQTYDEVTEDMLRNSAVVVVLWSQTSVKSKWVRAEATLGERNAVVIPAMIENADRPIMFELTQTADLIGWGGDRSNEQWQGFVTDIQSAIGKSKPETAPPAQAEDISQAPSNDATIETVFWTSIKDATDPADFEAYLKRYPDGHYSDLARNRLSATNPESAPSTPVESPALKIEPAPPTARPVTPAPTPAIERKSSFLPLLIGGVTVLAIAGWGVTKLVSNPSEDITTVTASASDVTQSECAFCPSMVAIPAGSFDFGSPASEPGRVGNEGPQRQLTISAFSISHTEITHENWAHCVADGQCAEKSGSGTMPVTRVNWDEANAYASWLSEKTDEAYRLPTEAEWEYAARGGTQTIFWWGDDIDRSITAASHTRDVTTLPDNPFGVSGMLINVREWVEDCYVNSYTERPGDSRAVVSGDCSRRVIRGGDWSKGPAEHRAANRARMAKTGIDSRLGFRIARTDR